VTALPEAIVWHGDALCGHLSLLDQRALPEREIILDLDDLEAVRDAISTLAVRGAPAIGIAAAYGLALHAGRAAAALDADAPGEAIDEAVEHAWRRLRSSRPTAVNLMWALDRCRDAHDHHSASLSAHQLAARLLLEAKIIHREDAELCASIARHGAPLLAGANGVLTHCHTGAIATGGIGTALGCIRRAHEDGADFTVYAGETRPLLQGARLTSWELDRLGIPVRLHSDNMPGHLMATGLIDAVIVGADRITARGDTANKIGTYQLAVLARHHDIPFYVAAASSTFDLAMVDGHEIAIEQRDPDEIRAPRGTFFAPPQVAVSNPAFDLTPAELITAIITERGVISPVAEDAIRAAFERPETPPAV